MKKEFIPYEQALKLKELGFDEECLAKYVPYLSQSGWRLCMDVEYWSGQITNSLLEQGFTAPLYQQAFRWFREKHELQFWIEPNFKNQYETEGHVYYIKNNCPYSIDYATYEEAELACLKKLIEIVKNK